MKRRWVKPLVITVFVLVIVAGVWVCINSASAADDKPITVRLEKVTTGDLQEYVSAPGEIEPKTNVEISAKVSARVVELPFKEGQQVKAGDVVIRLDSKEMESRLKSTQANYLAQQAQLEVTKSQIASRKAQLKGTEASLDQAKKDFERQKQLLASGDVSQSVFDVARQKFEELESQLQSSTYQIQAEEQGLIVAQHNLDAQKAQIDEAQDALEYTIIRSPIDGVITRINAEVGEMVMTGTMNNAGTVIMIIADLSKMLLVAQVDEADIGKLVLGQKATIRVKAYWDQTYEGVVDQIALTNDQSKTMTKYYRTEILLQGDVSKLYTGLTADVDIVTRQHAGIIKIPSQAVLSRKVDDLPLAVRDNNPNVDIKKNDVTVVYRYIDGKSVVTPVSIGPGDPTHIIIKSGLQVGDQVVVGPYKELDTLTDGKLLKDEREVEAEKKTQSNETQTQKRAA